MPEGEMMARRMFNSAIIETDRFTDMPATARLLYFELGMKTDDDGFVSSPKRIMRASGASDDDLRVLMAKEFVIVFQTGVLVITHHRVNNYLQNDRYRKTKHQNEYGSISIDSEGKYVEHIHSVSKMDNQHNITEHKREHIVGKIPDGNLLLFKKDQVKKKTGPTPGWPSTKQQNDLADEAIDYLNSVTGRRYQKVDASRKLIRRTFNKKKAAREPAPTLRDYQLIVDSMNQKWAGDAKMEQYLRPPTLFTPDGFDKYLGDAVSIGAVIEADLESCPECGNKMPRGYDLCYNCQIEGVEEHG